jgi:predicted peptidase
VHSSINGFYEFLPAGYNPSGSTEYPVFIFFHGAGEKGNGTTQLSAVLTNGLPKYINDNGGVFPYSAIVIAPQMNTDFPIFGVTAMVEYVYNNYKVNPSKVYLVGLSMGGGVILDWISQSKLAVFNIAGLVASCPASYVGDLPSAPGHAKDNRLPMRFYHGSADGVVGISTSTNWVNAVNGAPSIIPAAVLTTISGGNHQSGWDPVQSFAYNIGTGQNIYQWLLAQSKYRPLNTFKAIDCGSAVSTTIGGVTWEAETGYVSGGSTSSMTNIFGGYRSIGNTSYPSIHQTFRTGSGTQNWTIPMANGSYTVRLHFAEPSFVSVGQRVFNVNVEGGQGTLTNYDIVSLTGIRQVARTQDFPITLSDGSINISLTSVTDQNMISGIEILSTGTPNSPPIVNAGTDQLITLPTSTVSLSGTGSDPDGSVASTLWTKLSGPAGGAFTSATTYNTNFTGLTSGTYVFRLTATDNLGAITSDDVNVVVNTLPTVNAGTDKIVTLPTTSTTLTATAGDADGTITYAWTKLSGNSATITSPTSSSTGITGLSLGTYVFRLTVTDNLGGTAFDDVTVTVNNFAGSWTARQGVSMGSYTNGYYEWLPSSYNGVTKLPVIIYMHGLGEVGNGTTQLSLIETNEIPKLIKNAGGTPTFPYQAIVIAPQVSSPYPPASNLEQIIDYVKTNYSVDTNRIYLTGISMGGAGVLQWGNGGSIYKVAAIAPLCPAQTWPASYGDRFKFYHTPMWFFHGTVDGTVPYANSRRWVDSLNRAPSIRPQAQLTTLTGFDHNIWSTVYDYSYNIGNGQNIYEWLLSQSKTGTATTSVTVKAVDLGRTTSYVDPTGVTWLPETGLVTGNGGISYMTVITGSLQPIANTTLDTIYQELRFVNNNDTMQFDIPIANGNYTVRLHFVEHFALTAGYRRFNVNVENQGGLTNFDIFAQAGARFISVTRDFPVTVSDGSLYVGLRSVVDKALIAGIEIIAPGAPANKVPYSEAGADQSITQPASAVTLSGAMSYDTDGSITGYAWTKLTGTGGAIATPSAVTTNVTGLSVGTYTYKLAVTDNLGAVTNDTVQINVYSPAVNVLPIARAGTDQTITLPVTQVTLSGVTSSDADGSVVVYNWVKLTGGTANITSISGATTTVTSLSTGVYTFKLTVTDNVGGTATDTIQVTVNNSGAFSYLTGVYQVFYSTTYPVAAMITYDDNTSEKITSHSGSPVKRVTKRYQVVDGLSRPVAYIWFNDGFLRVVTKKGE